MKILVTGASGFLGRHVVRGLQQDGFDVTGFDLVATDDQELRFITGDLRDAEQVSAAVLGNDVVCHIGAIGDVYLAAEQPSLAADVNVGGTSHIADAAVADMGSVRRCPLRTDRRGPPSRSGPSVQHHEARR